MSLPNDDTDLKMLNDLRKMICQNRHRMTYADVNAAEKRYINGITNIHKSLIELEEASAIEVDTKGLTKPDYLQEKIRAHRMNPLESRLELLYAEARLLLKAATNIQYHNRRFPFVAAASDDFHRKIGEETDAMTFFITQCCLPWSTG